MISSSPSVFCKRDCRSLQRRVTAGKGRKSGQWGSALDNEDPTMIWGNLDNLPRDARGLPWQHGVQRTFLIFKSHNIAIISACGGIVINISWLQSDITKCIRGLYFCTAWLFCLKNIVMHWLIVDKLISFFADAPGLDHRMSAIAGMNPPPSLQVIYV